MNQAPDDWTAIWTKRRLHADRDPKQAVEIARNDYNQASPEEQAMAAAILGYALLRHENLGEAYTFLYQSATSFAEQKIPLLSLLAHRDVLFVGLLMGRSQQTDWQALVKEFQNNGQLVEVARTQMYLCLYHNKQGRPHDALKLAQECMTVLQDQGEPKDYGSMLRITASALSDCGSFEQALEQTHKAVEIFDELGWHVELARSLTERSWHHQRLGQYQEALNDLINAHTIFTQADMPRRIAICKLHLGLLSSRIGQYEIALALTLAARQYFVEHNEEDFIIQCDLNIGIIFYYAGLTQVALHAYEQAETAFCSRDNRRGKRSGECDKSRSR